MNRRTVQWILICATLLVSGLAGCAEHTSRSAATTATTTTTAATATGASSSSSSPTTGAHDVRRTVNYLASDALEGRGVDTPGIDRAADYIAGVYRQLGLEPLPSLHGSYFQSFDMTVGARVGEETELRIDDGGGDDDDAEPLLLGGDFVPVSFSADASFDAPVAFVGYGISRADRGYDDYAGLDVKGRAVLAMRFEPHTARGTSRFQDKGWSSDATLIAKARSAAEHGAAALLLVDPPKYHGIDDSLLPFAPSFKGPRSAIPVIHVSRETAGALLASAAGKDLAALQNAIDRSGQPASVALQGARAAGRVQILRNTRAVKNVVALLPGGRVGGAHADEYVVVGAHYDHLGHGTIGSMVPGSHEIHNGADDNASGVAAMLELAEQLRATSSSRRQPLDRSVLFVAFAAEEWGLIGSQHFVAHPPVLLEKITAMLNMDMVGRVRDHRLYVGGYGTAAPLKPIIDAADARSSIEIKSIGAGGMGPSDHMSFALARIPVLFFFSGMHADYHRPSDDADKINFDGIEQVVDFAQQTVRELASMPRAQYVDASDGDQSPMLGSHASPTDSRMILGVVPDYNEAESTSGGVKIQGTVPGSPADQAGLQRGDVIVRFGDSAIGSLYDLSDRIAKTTPGETVTLTIDRNGQAIQLRATMRQRGEDRGNPP